MPSSLFPHSSFSSTTSNFAMDGRAKELNELKSSLQETVKEEAAPMTEGLNLLCAAMEGDMK